MSFENESRQERDQRVKAENRTIGNVFKIVCFVFASALIPVYTLYKSRPSALSFMDQQDPKAHGVLRFNTFLLFVVYPILSLGVAGFFSFAVEGGAVAILFALPLGVAWIAVAQQWAARQFTVYRVKTILVDAFKAASTPSAAEFKFLICTIVAQIALLIIGASSGAIPLAWVAVMLAGYPFAMKLAAAMNERAVAEEEEDRQNARLLAMLMETSTDTIRDIFISAEGSREAGTFYLRTGEIPPELVKTVKKLYETVPELAPDLEVRQADHARVVLQSASEETQRKREQLAQTEGMAEEITTVEPDAGFDWDMFK